MTLGSISPFNELMSRRDLWSLYTKEEEYSPRFIDRYNRCVYSASRHRDPFVPSVSDFFNNLVGKVTYPDGKKFGVCFTHDIDVIYLSKIRMLLGIRRTFLAGHYSEAARRAISLTFPRIKKFNPIINFKRIMALESQYGARSTFFFMAPSARAEDYNYDLKDLRDEFKEILEAGFEIGLHGSIKAHDSPDVILEEKERLETALACPVTGYRNHRLHFKLPETWEYLSSAGFRYDSTFAYPDMVGFKNGMCHPYKPYNLNAGRFVDIIEIPLVVMEGSLSDYMQLGEDTAWKVIRDLVDIVAEKSGVITFLWHNTTLDEYFAPESYRMYVRLLEYCRQKNAWMTTMQQMCQHALDSQKYLSEE
jgi:peptidoglycan/xylan/chitin deacetylase (PgdA/CDA1 family)